MCRRKRSLRRITALISVLLVLTFCVLPDAASAGPRRPGVFRTQPSLGYPIGGLSPGPFRFLVASDSHFGSSAGNKRSGMTLAALGQKYPGAAFLIHLGDITETGSSSEYDLYDSFASGLPFPVFETPGNHESRWQDRFTEKFRGRYGTGSYSFNYRGWHFVVLDTTYPGQTYGSLDPSVLSWLERDLASLPVGRPTVVFAHHPLLYEPRRFQDSDDLLLSLLGRYPVKAIFCGHGHTFVHWKAQGIDLFMVGALMDGAYAVVEVAPEEMRVYAEKLVFDPVVPAGLRDDVPVERTLLGTVGVKKEDSPETPLRSLHLTTTGDGTGLHVTFDLAEEAFLYYQIDGGPFVPLGVRPPGKQELELDISGHARGTHTLRLKAHFPGREGPYYAAAEFGKLEGDLVLWKIDLQSSVTHLLQTSVTTVVAGTRDGLVLALDTVTGSRVWEYRADSAYAGGAVFSGNLYFTTATGEVFCLDAGSGRFRWKATLDPSGFAAPPSVLVHGDEAVLVGSMSGTVYALDPGYGRVKWSYRSGGAITGKIACGQGYVVFGTWGDGLHAIDSKDGSRLWHVPLGRQIYYSPAGTPLVLGDTVYVSTPFDAATGAGFVYAFHLWTGREIGRWPFSGTVLDPVPYVSTSGARGSLPAGAWSSTGFPVSAAAGCLVLPLSSGTVLVHDVQSGEDVEVFHGDPTLFSTVASLDGLYVTGGARGLVNIFFDGHRVDYKVRDSFLFTDPLLTFVPGGILRFSDGRSSRYLLIVADTRGILWAVGIPETP